MPILIAIDPGNISTACVVLTENGRPSAAVKLPNAEVPMWLRRAIDDVVGDAPTVVIERVESYGMPVGVEVFDTVRWAGRFEQVALDMECGLALLPRREVKLHLCGQSRAKDGNVRQAIIDRFGGKVQAVGTKHSPGPLHGFSGDLWAALAVGLTWHDRLTTPAATSAPAVDLAAEVLF